jgi:branched-subunit amino acid transport protein
MSRWLIVFGMGAVTYGIRLSMLVFVRHDALPAYARSALRYVMPAVLAAIISPAVLYAGTDDKFDAGFGNERLIAAIIAAGVAWATKNTWLTIAAGMSALWLLNA